MAYENPDAYYRDESFLEHMKRGASFRCLRVAVEIGEPICSGRHVAGGAQGANP